MLHTIKIAGCDGTTEFNIDCTSEEAELIQHISQLSKEASPYGCFPVLLLEEGDTVDPEYKDNF